MLTDGDVSLGEPSDIESYLIAQLDAATPAWGAPDPNMVYALILPAGVSVSSSGVPADTCAAGMLSWHTAMTLPAHAVTIQYVVVARCGTLPGLSALDSVTVPLSHSLIEAVTNPRLDAVGGFDAGHAAWQLVVGNTEVASACVAQLYGDPALIVRPADLPYAVQRSWSNNAAQAGHAPCVPAPSTPYFDVAPVLNAQINAQLSPLAGASPASVAGVLLPLGGRATVDLALFSDAATGPWTVTASELGSKSLAPPALDKNEGSNGTILHLTLQTSDMASAGQQLVQIQSTLGAVNHYAYVLVHQ